MNAMQGVQQHSEKGKTVTFGGFTLFVAPFPSSATLGKAAKLSAPEIACQAAEKPEGRGRCR